MFEYFLIGLVLTAFLMMMLSVCCCAPRGAPRKSGFREPRSGERLTHYSPSTTCQSCTVCRNHGCIPTGSTVINIATDSTPSPDNSNCGNSSVNNNPHLHGHCCGSCGNDHGAQYRHGAAGNLEVNNYTNSHGNSGDCSGCGHGSPPAYTSDGGNGGGNFRGGGCTCEGSSRGGLISS